MESNIMTKAFKDLNLGDKFTVNGVEYTKIAEVKVSCCRAINAQASANSDQRTFFAPGTTVEVNA